MLSRRLPVTGVAILLVLVGSVFIFLKIQTAPRWTGMTIRSVSMISPSEGWAVGAISGSSNTLLLHYTAGYWTVVAPPANLDAMADLSAVAMVSRDEGWAVGQIPVPLSSPRAFRPSGLVLHYSDGRWSVATAPWREYLSGVAARSPKDVWAVGYGLVIHYDGRRWTEIDVPPGERNMLFSAVSLSPDGSVWVVGGGDILRYDGRTWQRQEIPPTIDGNGLNITDLAMTSATSGWAVGTIYNSPRGVILHDVVGRWVVEQETDIGLMAVSLSSSDEGWAVGGSMIMRYSHGRWEAQSEDAPDLLDVAIVSSSDAWAVGPDKVLRFQNGSWQDDNDLRWQQDALRRYDGG